MINKQGKQATATSNSRTRKATKKLKKKKLLVEKIQKTEKPVKIFLLKDNANDILDMFKMNV